MKKNIFILIIIFLAIFNPQTNFANDFKFFGGTRAIPSVPRTGAAWRSSTARRKICWLAVTATCVPCGESAIVGHCGAVKFTPFDKLVDNAVSFSSSGDEIEIALSSANRETCLSVSNPGPPLPERMRTQMFDSMVSMRPHKDNKHLGLGLYIAKLIADGHDGRIRADNVEGGVRFTVCLPML